MVLAEVFRLAVDSAAIPPSRADGRATFVRAGLGAALVATAAAPAFTLTAATAVTGWARPSPPGVAAVPSLPPLRAERALVALSVLLVLWLAAPAGSAIDTDLLRPDDAEAPFSLATTLLHTDSDNSARRKGFPTAVPSTPARPAGCSRSQANTAKPVSSVASQPGLHCTPRCSRSLPREQRLSVNCRSCRVPRAQ